MTPSPHASWPIDPVRLVEQREFLRALARGLVGDEHAAEDAVQDAWVAALERPPRSVQSLRGWLARVTGNAARKRANDERARRERERRAARPEQVDDLRIADREFELQEQVGRALQTLPEPYRTALFLRYYRDLPPGEIAAREGVPLQTAKTRLRRGLEHLRVQLDASYGRRRNWTPAVLALLDPPPLVAPIPAGAGTGVAAALKGALTMKGTVAAIAALVAVTAIVLINRGLAPKPADSVAVAKMSEALDPTAQESDARASNVEAAPDSDRAPVDSLDPAPTADGPPTLRVVVVDDRGVGVPGAEVRIEDRTELVLAAEDGAAQFSLDGIDPEEHEVEMHVQAPGHLPVRVALSTTSAQVVLVRAASVSGRVLDAQGVPVEGAAVTVAESGIIPKFSGASGEQARATARGEFTLAGLRPGTLRVWAATGLFPEGCSGIVSLEPGASVKDVEVFIQPPAGAEEIAGIVRLPEGIPPEAVQVVYMVDTEEGSRAGVAPIDESGRFRFQTEGRAPHDVWAADRLDEWDAERLVYTGERPLAGWRGVVATAVAPGTTDLVLSLTEARSVELRVTDIAGQPIESYTLGVYEGVGTDLRKDCLWSTSATPATRLSVPSTEFRLSFAAEGFEQLWLGPYEGHTVPDLVHAALDERPILTGTVTAGEKPVRGARVRLLGAAVRWRVMSEGFLLKTDSAPAGQDTTGEAGDFAITLRHAEDAWLVASAPGWADAVVGPEFFDPEGLVPRPIELELTPGGSVEGRVNVSTDVDPAGWVVGASQGFPGGRSLVIGSDGRFRFDGLTPGPWWVGRLRGGPVSSISSSDGPVNWTSTCEVVEGETTKLDLDFMQLEPCRVIGHLEFGGEPAVGWRTKLLVGDGGPFNDPPTSDQSPVGGNGSFELGAEMPGEYSLAFEKRDVEGLALGGYRVVTLESGTTEINIDLKSGTLVGRVSAGDDDPPFVVWLLEHPDGLTMTRVALGPDGSFSELVPAGRGTLRRPRPPLDESLVTWPVLAEVDLRPGGTARVDNVE